MECDVPLRLINVVLRLHFLDPNLHALLPKTDVLFLHLLRGFVRDIRDDCIDCEADEDGYCESEE